MGASGGFDCCFLRPLGDEMTILQAFDLGIAFAVLIVALALRTETNGD